MGASEHVGMFNVHLAMHACSKCAILSHFWVDGSCQAIKHPFLESPYILCLIIHSRLLLAHESWLMAMQSGENGCSAHIADQRQIFMHHTHFFLDASCCTYIICVHLFTLHAMMMMMYIWLYGATAFLLLLNRQSIDKKSKKQTIRK